MNNRYLFKSLSILKLLILLFISLDSIAQSNNTNEQKVFTQAEKMPIFTPDLNTYLEKQIENYKSEIIGITYISCIINENGKIIKPTILKSSGNTQNDKKALDVVSNMPKWIPAKQNGVNCAVKYIIPVNFQKKKSEQHNNQKIENNTSIIKYVQQRVKYYDAFNKISGTTYISFYIDKNKNIEKIKIMKSCHNKDGDDIALRIITSIPKHIINQEKNKKQTIAINFNGEKRNTIKSDNKIRAIVDEQPIYMGGEQALQDYIKTKTKELNKNNITGKAFVAFVIDEKGRAIEPKIIKSSGTYTGDKIIKQIIINMPLWRPGIQNGKAVKVKQNRPINLEA